jgi:hypothetical protein
MYVVGASLASPGAMEALEHRLPKDLPIRALFLADRSDGGKPDWTYNMLLCCSNHIPSYNLAFSSSITSRESYS